MTQEEIRIRDIPTAISVQSYASLNRDFKYMICYVCHGQAQYITARSPTSKRSYFVCKQCHFDLLMRKCDF